MLLAKHRTRVAIAGGGIGGLAMALQCHRRGIECTVFEAAEKLAVEEAKLVETTSAAEARIMKARESAMSNVRGIANDAAQAIVTKLTGKAATAAELQAVGKA